MTQKKAAPAQPAAARAPLTLWTFYRVRFNFLTKLCSSVPADPAIIQKWLEARQPAVKAPGAASINEINEEVLESIARGEGEAPQDYQMLVFQRDNGVLVMRAATVRAHIKDCARQLSTMFVGKIQGEKAFSTRVVNGVYLDEHDYWLPILRDGFPLAEPDGADDKPVHAMTPTGRINALKRFEYVWRPSLEFTLKVLGKAVTEADLHHLFTYGGTHGYAGERGDGEGRYEYTLDRIEAPTRGAEAGQHRRGVAEE